MSSTQIQQPEGSSREQIDRYRTIREQSKSICAPLEIEDYQIQPMADASPPKWHLAHVTWFFETFILGKYHKRYQQYHPAYEQLFNSYYNGVGKPYPRAKRGLLSRPTVAEIMRYRAHVDEHMIALIEQNDNPELVWLVELGLNHEQQHQELLLTDIKYNLGHNPLMPVYRARAEMAEDPNTTDEVKFTEITGGQKTIGKNPGDGFLFDNESPAHDVLLQDFRLANRLVTNREFVDFIEDGGYERPELWLSDGWANLQSRKQQLNGSALLPLYWTKEGDQYLCYTLSGQKPVENNLPVCHVSGYEADAFARWKGCRLPTEIEWETAAATCPIEGNFVETGHLHPRAVSNDDRPTQMFGDAWEWTSSSYSAYPGFDPFAGLIGEYNGKFMANQLVLRGGSCVTPLSHIRRTYRNFFYPPDRWQFTGIRLAMDVR